MKESSIRLFFNRLSLMIKMFLLFTTAGAAGRVLFYAKGCKALCRTACPDALTWQKPCHGEETV